MRALVFVCLFAAAAHGQESSKIVQAMRQLDSGDYAEAIATLRTNYQERVRAFGADAPATLDAQYLLALGLVEAGKIDEGMTLSKKLLDRRREKGSAAELSDAELLYGSALRESGNSKEAVRVMKRALERGVDPRRLWRARNQFALSLAYAGRPKEAMEVALLALEVAPDDRDIRAHQILTIAQLHLALGNWRQAEVEAARAREMSADLAPERAVQYSTLGIACLRQGRSIEAERYLRQALETTERMLDPNSSEIGTLLVYLSEAMRVNGRQREAMEIAKRSEDIWRRVGASVSVWSLTKNPK